MGGGDRIGLEHVVSHGRFFFFRNGASSKQWTDPPVGQHPRRNLRGTEARPPADCRNGRARGASGRNQRFRVRPWSESVGGIRPPGAPDVT